MCPLVSHFKMISYNNVPSGYWNRIDTPNGIFFSGFKNCFFKGFKNQFKDARNTCIISSISITIAISVSLFEALCFFNWGCRWGVIKEVVKKKKEKKINIWQLPYSNQPPLPAAVWMQSRLACSSSLRPDISSIRAHSSCVSGDI